MDDEVLALLEEIRSIAQTGMRYAKDPYDLERTNGFSISLESAMRE